MKIYKLGEMVRDIVSDTEGMLTHMTVNMDKNEQYVFQPRGLNPETQQPVEKIYIDKSRIIGAIEEEISIPVEILGTEAEDIATGFKGIIIGLIYHINGCLHVDIKPKGILTNTGSTIQSHEFDIRRVKGLVIPNLTKFKMKVSIKKNPSPDLINIKTKFNK